MPRFERCSINDGTKSKLYDLFRICHNALRSMMVGAVKTLNFMSDNIFILLPGKSMALPVCINGVFSIPEMPDVKVWAVKTSIYNPFTEEYETLSTVPLFKDSLESIWRDVVEPFDTPISGTEYMYYEDDDGSIRQGFDWYGPGDHKYFYLLADGGPAVRDMGILLVFIYLLNALGLFDMVHKFIQAVLCNIKNAVMRRQISAIYKNLDNILVDLSTIISCVTDGQKTVLSIDKEMQAQLGVRLLLR